jgi:hypothetical protein
VAMGYKMMSTQIAINCSNIEPLSNACYKEADRGVEHSSFEMYTRLERSLTGQTKSRKIENFHK